MKRRSNRRAVSLKQAAIGLAVTFATAVALIKPPVVTRAFGAIDALATSTMDAIVKGTTSGLELLLNIIAMLLVLRVAAQTGFELRIVVMADGDALRRPPGLLWSHNLRRGGFGTRRLAFATFPRADLARADFAGVDSAAVLRRLEVFRAADFALAPFCTGISAAGTRRRSRAIRRA